jgi:HEAT repeat protein
MVFILLFCVLACSGCGKKSTDQLIADLKSSQVKERLIAVRLLQERKGDAAKVVPALIEALKDGEDDIRVSAAIGLGYFGEEAKDAISPLQAVLRDKDPRVREAAGVALSRIDPSLAQNAAPASTKKAPKTGPSKPPKK